MITSGSLVDDLSANATPTLTCFPTQCTGSDDSTLAERAKPHRPTCAKRLVGCVTAVQSTRRCSAVGCISASAASSRRPSEAAKKLAAQKAQEERAAMSALLGVAAGASADLSAINVRLKKLSTDAVNHAKTEEQLYDKVTTIFKAVLQCLRPRHRAMHSPMKCTTFPSCCVASTAVISLMRNVGT